MTAVVYTSASGFTKKYAEILSAETTIPVYNLKEAKEKLSKGAEIIYMGWLFAGGVKGYNNAIKRYSVKAVCAVGMGNPSDKVISEIKERHHIENMKLFYLQGGFDINKLHGLYIILMKGMSKSIIKQIEAKPDQTPDDAVTLDMMKNGKNMVSEKNLVPVIGWIKENNL